MLEAQAVAQALGVSLPVDVDQRIDWASDVGDHKTSMLQDYEAGRELEIDAVVSAVSELGSWTGIATPTLDATLAQVRQLLPPP